MQSTQRTIDLPLRPIGAFVALTILLPDGTPAAGAEVLSMAPAALWRDRSNERGVLRVPRSLDGALLAIRHPRAASTVRQWHAATDAVQWTLAAAAPTPLIVRAVDRNGNPARGARVVAWLDGIRVPFDTLAFLGWSTPAADASGVWSARNLPAAPLRVLVVSDRVALPAVAGGAYDAMATLVEAPWSGTQRVVAIE